MRNNLSTLNNYLFEELERLNDDEELQDDKLERELKRAKAITQVSMAVVNNARTILEAKRTADYMGKSEKEVLMLDESN